jgi:hypothetical protein
MSHFFMTLEDTKKMNFVETYRRQANAGHAVHQIKTAIGASTVSIRAGGPLGTSKQQLDQALSSANEITSALSARYSQTGFHEHVRFERDYAPIKQGFQSAQKAARNERDSIAALEGKLSAVAWAVDDPSEAARAILLQRLLSLPVGPRIASANANRVSRMLLLEIGSEASGLPVEIFEKLQQMQRRDGFARVATAQGLASIQAKPTATDPLAQGIDEVALETLVETETAKLTARHDAVEEMKQILGNIAMWVSVLMRVKPDQALELLSATS